MTNSAVRQRPFANFSDLAPEAINAHRHWLMRAHNFEVEWVELAPGPTGAQYESVFESLIITEGGAMDVVTRSAHGMNFMASIPDHAVGILPAGRHQLTAKTPARVALITSQRSDIQGRRVINAEGCDPRDPRVLPTGKPYRRINPMEGIQVLPLDMIKASPDKPRLKMLQTETLSLNLVEYNGPRNRAELSPHSHANFEQGSLALAGEFVHHLRVPWGGDANLWREDEHLSAGSPSLLVIPVELVHTTEGVGEGRHYLIDVFSPPRKDFISKGWVFNSADYEEIKG